MERVNKAGPHFLPRLTWYLKWWWYVGKGSAKKSAVVEAVLVMRESGTQEKLHFLLQMCSFQMWMPSISECQYIACISVSKHLKSFFPSVSKIPIKLPSASLCLCWAGAISPQPRAVALTEIGLELPDLLQSSRIRSQQRSVWQWQRSIQLCNTPILLMHFTLSRLNCFGLLVYFSSSKQNNFFPPFPWQRVLPYAPNQLQPFWCFVTAHILGCIQKKWQLKHFCFCSNQIKIETFCSLIQGLMCLITPLLLSI